MVSALLVACSLDLPATVRDRDAGADAVADGATSELAECTSQRVVHIVGANGSAAWFNLIWPAPVVIENFQPTYAYDDPKLAVDVGSFTGHPLYARTLGTRAVWQGTGSHPMPTVLVAGGNHTHTDSPPTTFLTNGTDIVAAAAALQKGLAASLPVFVLKLPGTSTPPLYGVAGAPQPVTV